MDTFLDMLPTSLVLYMGMLSDLLFLLQSLFKEGYVSLRGVVLSRLLLLGKLIELQLLVNLIDFLLKSLEVVV